MKTFKHLADKIVKFILRSSPVQATHVGCHLYDHELDTVDLDSILERHGQRKDFLRQLQDIAQETLTDDEHIDLQLIVGALQSDIRTEEALRPWQTNPVRYIRLCMHGLYTLLYRDYAPVEQRAEAFLQRAKKIPGLLRTAQHSLEESPAVFTRVALEQTGSAVHFSQHMITRIASTVPCIGKDLDRIRPKLLSAFDGYAQFLSTKIRTQRRGFAIGARLFDFMLKNDHMLPYGMHDIADIGKAAKRNAQRELKQLARTIHKKKSWKAVAADLKKQHPEQGQLTTAYRREMKKVKRFVKDQKLVAIPPNETLRVVPTPLFQRSLLPFAAYMPVAPLEEEQVGFFYVTPIGRRLTDEQKEKQLQGHSKYKIPIIALHEGYPGHHLQLTHASRAGSMLRKLLRTTVFVEGWALYCEEMMYEAGYYTDPRIVFMKWLAELWRACRVLIDVGLHTRTMSYQQAVDFLVRDALVEPVHAEKEVTRYTLSPTQPLSYVIGKKQILALRSAYQKKAGTAFRLRDFHDELLSFGSIPVVLIQRAMGL
ncbi:MAG: DUF885 domain-containing protein [candidate division WOR-3 bacterium]|nr:MAG: DUF885 domain-containing protein [candidate division WOR-3 bacterium]